MSYDDDGLVISLDEDDTKNSPVTVIDEEETNDPRNLKVLMLCLSSVSFYLIFLIYSCYHQLLHHCFPSQSHLSTEENFRSGTFTYISILIPATSSKTFPTPPLDYIRLIILSL